MEIFGSRINRVYRFGVKASLGGKIQVFWDFLGLKILRTYDFCV